MPDSTNDEKLLKSIDEIMPQCGEIDCYTCNSRHKRVLNLIHQHTERAVREARLDEKEFWQRSVDVDYVECSGFKCRLLWCGSCYGDDRAERESAIAKAAINDHVVQLTTNHKGGDRA